MWETNFILGISTSDAEACPNTTKSSNIYDKIQLYFAVENTSPADKPETRIGVKVLVVRGSYSPVTSIGTSTTTHFFTTNQEEAIPSSQMLI